MFGCWITEKALSERLADSQGESVEYEGFIVWLGTYECRLSGKTEESVVRIPDGRRTFKSRP